MRRTQYVVLLALVIVAIGGLSVIDANALTNCTYTVSCVYNQQTEQYDCTVTGVHCGSFMDPDCDNACDAEYDDCQSDCVGQGGGTSQCMSACNKVYVACFRACIPSV